MDPTLTFPRALRAPLLVAFLASAAGMAAPWVGLAQSSADPALVPPPPGTWQSVANGDRVQGLLRSGDTVWSATGGGGALRWNLSTGEHRQYLAPQDGLPSSDVRALARDPRGRLWAATAAGLAWLDAGRDQWVPVAVRHPELESDAATALAVGPDGGLWVGFEERWDPEAVDPERGEAGAFVGGGVARYDVAQGGWGPVWRSFESDEAPGRYGPLPSSNITALAFDGAGRLWVGTRPFHAWGESADDPAGDGSGGWLAVGGGLAVLDRPLDVGGSSVSWQPESDPCVPATIHALAVDAAGTVWAGTAGRGLQAFARGPATRACEPDGGHAVFRRARPPQLGLPGNTVLSVAIGGDGRVWSGVAEGSGGGRGLAVLDHGGTLGRAEGDTADDVWTLVRAIQPEGVTDPDAVLPAALALARDASVPGPAVKDDLVVGTQGEKAEDGWGLVRWAGQAEWRTFATAVDGLPSNRISAVGVEPATGATWFGTEGRGVARWDGQRWQAWRWSTGAGGGQSGSPAGGPAGDAVTAIAFGADGRVWVGSRPTIWDRAKESWANGGLAAFDGRGWTVFGPENSPLPSHTVQALAFDLAGRLWIGTEGRGVAVHDGAAGTWSLIDAEQAGAGFGGNNVTGIAADLQTGAVWLAHGVALVCDPAKLPDTCELVKQGGGVSRWEGGQWQRWGKSTGAPLEAFGGDGEITSLVFDRGRGRVWAGAWAPASDSFHWLLGHGIDAALNGCPRDCGDAAWTSARFRDAGAVRALALDAGGRLWVGLNRGGSGVVPPRSGLRMLDGSERWSAWTAATSQLPGDEVTALASGGDGMWVGTLDRGAALWRPFVIRARAFLPVAESN